MPSYTVSRTINAPLPLVFESIADVRNFAEIIPEITNIEFLTEQHYGPGTRFNETRRMKGGNSTVMLEVTELEPDHHIRLISNAGGTIWDSVFTVTEKDNQTLLTLQMDARPYRFFARIMNVMIKKMLTNALNRDLDTIKTFCENKATSSATPQDTPNA